MVMGCSGSNKGAISTKTPEVTPTPVKTQAPSYQGLDGTPAGSFSTYMDIKSKAYDRVSAKIEENEELSMSLGLAVLPVTMVDLALIPLTVVGLDQKTGEMALSSLGIQGVKIEQSGSVYTLSYKDDKGNTIKQTCEYDAATDSVKSSVIENNKEIMYFEYVKVGKGYASQYFMLDEESGHYSLITGFFDESSIVAFGFEEATKKPSSIYKGTGITKDFVINDDTYFILENNKLTVLENGKTKTY
jgi:hypothetical protein